MSSDRPPFLILVRTTTAASSLVARDSQSQLEHPVIQYHYTDDSPLLALPKSDNELVVLLDYHHQNHAVPSRPITNTALPTTTAATMTTTTTTTTAATAPGTIGARSLSPAVVATSVSISPALDDGTLNDQMYTINLQLSERAAATNGGGAGGNNVHKNPRPRYHPQSNAQAILDQFKLKNSVLRAALDYPAVTMSQSNGATQ